MMQIVFSNRVILIRGNEQGGFVLLNLIDVIHLYLTQISLAIMCCFPGSLCCEWALGLRRTHERNMGNGLTTRNKRIIFLAFTHQKILPSDHSHGCLCVFFLFQFFYMPLQLDEGKLSKFYTVVSYNWVKIFLILIILKGRAH